MITITNYFENLQVPLSIEVTRGFRTVVNILHLITNATYPKIFDAERVIHGVLGAAARRVHGRAEGRQSRAAAATH